jgi:methylmalonyl-CoA mutase
VLLEEAGLSWVADPAAGSGYVEEMTEALAAAAWELFRDIEREGGIIASLRAGRFQARVLEARLGRETDVARRIEAIVGVSEHPWLAELAPDLLSARPHEVQVSGEPIPLPDPGCGRRFEALVAAVRDGASMADILATIGYEWERTDKAPWWRIAEPFERLRDASDAALAAGGQRPSVYLAHVGPGSAFAERSEWVRKALETGGIVTIPGDEATDVEEIARGFSNSGARIACICPGDGHEEAMPTLARWLRTAGARRVQCIAAPDDEAALRAGGVDVVLYEGCDILAELETVHALLGLTGVTAGRSGPKVP